MADVSYTSLYMERALNLARRGMGRVHPNPLVGAVIVRDGEVVGEGWHAAFGGDHAEVVALRDAGPRAGGSTLFVTLEPCCIHAKTPPCTDAVIGAGVRRVVIAVLDPNPRIAGRGVEQLRAAGIEVEIGVEAAPARELNAPFFCHQLEGRAHVTVKIAASLDGRIADRHGRSQWLTGVEARTEVHRLRADADAIAVGRRTVELDNPSLTVRHVEGANPVRMVFDSRGALNDHCTVFTDGAPTVHITLPGFTSSAASRDSVEHWEVGAEAGEGVPSVATVAQRAAERGWISLLVEGGGELVASCFRAGLVDRARVFVAPLIIGNRNAPGWVDGLGADSLDEARRLHVTDVRRFGEDVLLEMESGARSVRAVS